MIVNGIERPHNVLTLSDRCGRSIRRSIRSARRWITAWLCARHLYDV